MFGETDIMEKLPGFIDFYVISLSIIIVIALIYMLIRVVKFIKSIIVRVRNKKVWSRIVSDWYGCRVYCLGRLIDVDKVNIKALNREDWKFKYNIKSKEIYLNPKDITVVSKEGEDLRVLPLCDSNAGSEDDVMFIL